MSLHTFDKQPTAENFNHQNSSKTHKIEKFKKSW